MGFGEEEVGIIGLADEVLIGHSADGLGVLLFGRFLKKQRGLHFRSQHPQVWRQHVDKYLDEMQFYSVISFYIIIHLL